MLFFLWYDVGDVCFLLGIDDLGWDVLLWLMNGVIYIFGLLVVVVLIIIVIGVLVGIFVGISCGICLSFLNYLFDIILLILLLLLVIIIIVILGFGLMNIVWVIILVLLL